MDKTKSTTTLAWANAKKAVKGNLCQTQYNSGYKASNIMKKEINIIYDFL